MKLLTLMLKELIEIIEILQFRRYFKLGMSLHKLMCPVWQFFILLLFASREARKMAPYQYFLELASDLQLSFISTRISLGKSPE